MVWAAGRSTLKRSYSSLDGLPTGLAQASFKTEAILIYIGQTAYLFSWLSVTALWQRHCLDYQDFKPSFMFCPLKLCFCLRKSNWFCFELTEIHLTEHRSRLEFEVHPSVTTDTWVFINQSLNKSNIEKFYSYYI